MAPFPWLVLLENFAYQQLMRSPTFHRAVEQVVKTVHRARHGIPPDELGGTRLDEPNSRFGRHFVEELRTQLGQVEKEQAGSGKAQITNGRENGINSHANSSSTAPVGEDAESAWRELQQRGPDAPRQGFMGNYLETLRGQVGEKKPPP